MSVLADQLPASLYGACSLLPMLRFWHAAAQASQHMRRRSQVPGAHQGSTASDQLQQGSQSRAAGQGASAQHVRPHSQQQGERQRQEQFHEQQLQWLEQLNEQQPQPQPQSQPQRAEDQSSAASLQPERWQQVRRRLSAWHWGPWQHPRRRLQQERPQQPDGTAAQHSTEAEGPDDAAVQAGGMHRNVAMLTAIPPTPCKAPLADLINSLSLANKVLAAGVCMCDATVNASDCQYLPMSHST